MNNQEKTGMTLIVKTVTRLTVGLIFLYGVYIVLHGHLTPGGGFAGGVILALSFVHLVLAYGRREAARRITDRSVSRIEGLGAVAFLAVGLLGLAGGYFFLNVLPKGNAHQLFSAGIIPVCNVAICLKVSAGLFAIFIALVLLHPEQGHEK